MWAGKRTGDWAEDNRLGAAYARACLDHMRAAGFPGLLYYVVRDMPDELGGVEVGFLHAIAQSAMEGACTPVARPVGRDSRPGPSRAGAA